jgi:hypothetical protein
MELGSRRVRSQHMVLFNLAGLDKVFGVIFQLTPAEWRQMEHGMARMELGSRPVCS